MFFDILNVYLAASRIVFFVSKIGWISSRYDHPVYTIRMVHVPIMYLSNRIHIYIYRNVYMYIAGILQCRQVRAAKSLSYFRNKRTRSTALARPAFVERIVYRERSTRPDKHTHTYSI